MNTSLYCIYILGIRMVFTPFQPTSKTPKEKSSKVAALDDSLYTVIGSYSISIVKKKLKCKECHKKEKN